MEIRRSSLNRFVQFFNEIPFRPVTGFRLRFFLPPTNGNRPICGIWPAPRRLSRVTCPASAAHASRKVLKDLRYPVDFPMEPVGTGSWTCLPKNGGKLTRGRCSKAGWTQILEWANFIGSSLRPVERSAPKRKRDSGLPQQRGRLT